MFDAQSRDREIVVGAHFAMVLDLVDEDGLPLNVASATSIVASFFVGGLEVIPATLQDSGAHGADWADAVVVVEFTATQTATLAALIGQQGQVRLIAVQDAKRYPFGPHVARIVKGPA